MQDMLPPRARLRLHIVGEAAFKMRGVAPRLMLAVRFNVEVGDQVSAEQIAFVEPTGEGGLGLTGHLRNSLRTDRF
jgi:hypothetical protein